MIRIYIRFRNITERLYFIPAYYGLLATALSLFLVFLDNNYVEILQKYIPANFFTSVDIAKIILSTLAGSLFAMITVSFSTIMVVLTMYSSQFSPRTMQDFLNSKVTLKVLGIFFAAFIYSILTLLFLDDQSGGDRQVFTSVIGVFIAIICLAYFVYFIHHVASSVQVNILIKKLRDEIIEIVDRIEEETEKDEQVQNDPPEHMEQMLSEEPYYIYSNQRGFIQSLDLKKLSDIAVENNLVIKAEKMIGDYVTENSKLLSIRPQEPFKFLLNNDLDLEQKSMKELKKDAKEIIMEKNCDSFNVKNGQKKIDKISPEQFLKYIVIGNERSKKNDMEFGILKLTEVALKAISPGINDPNTAIFCINQLGWVLSRIAVSNIESTYHYDPNGQLKLIIEDISFQELLYKTFFQICHYGREDVSVLGAILDALLIIAEGSPDDVQEILWIFSHYVLEAFDISLLQLEDKKFLNYKLGRLAAETGKSKDYEFFQINEE
ncbi:DUF2254 domain-containing protein [Natronospora cellulosivora (SeqCode)]